MYKIKIPGAGSALESIGTHVSRVSPPKNTSSEYLLKQGKNDINTHYYYTYLPGYLLFNSLRLYPSKQILQSDTSFGH